MSSKVLLIYTGGTIGMNRNPQTGALEPFDFEHLLNHVPELQQFDTTIDTFQFSPPIDSSDMTLDEVVEAVLAALPVDWLGCGESGSTQSSRNETGMK